MDDQRRIVENCVLDIIAILVGGSGDWLGSHRFGWLAYRRGDVSVEVARVGRDMTPPRWSIMDAAMTRSHQDRLRADREWRAKMATEIDNAVRDGTDATRCDEWWVDYSLYCLIEHAQFLAEAFYVERTDSRLASRLRNGGVRTFARRVYDVTVVGDERALVREAIYLKLQEDGYVR